MSKAATWKILSWPDRPADTSFSIPYDCDSCGRCFDLPCGRLTGAALVAMARDGWLIFDPPGFVPPPNWLPTEIQCPNCGSRLLSNGLEAEPEIPEETHVR
jgi:DNA-directed RNA polymerase subunit RPC12/RpoP